LKLHSFIILFGTGIIIITFFVSLFFIKREKPRYYNYIFIFIILGILVSANTIKSNYNAWVINNKTSIVIEQTLLLFQTLMLGLFFVDILNKSIFGKLIKQLLFLSILIQVILLLLVLIANTEIRPTIAPNFFLLIFCFLYLRDLMTSKPTLILSRSSAFWIVMGIFYSSCVGFPVNSLIPFIPKNQEFLNLRRQIFSSYNMSIIVLYTCIIKSYLCLKPPQNL